jgi:hypothetical protein
VSRAVRIGTVIAMAIAIGKLQWAGVALDGLAVAVIVIYAARRHPLMDCWRCGGRRSIRSWYMPWAKGPCPACGGSGSKRRRSSKAFEPDLARRIPPKAASDDNSY